METLHHDFYSKFKFRQDVSSSKQIVLFRVSSSNCLNEVSRFIISSFNSIFQKKPKISFLRIIGHENVLNKLQNLSHKGRLTPENIFNQIEKKKINNYSIRDSYIILNKKWCYRRGILVENKVFGCDIFIDSSN